MSTDTEGVGAPTPPQTFYVTFGVKYPDTTHPVWRWASSDGHIKVIAENEEAARELVRRAIGLWYAFIYDEAHWAEGSGMKRLLATIYEDGSASVPRSLDNGNAEPPNARFGTSDPEYYGHENTEVVCARIEGTLANDSDADCIEALGYEAEHVHLHCFPEGVALFREVTDVDYRVQAGELDWSVPYECPVCETSIT
jgi:hypothetical protein